MFLTYNFRAFRLHKALNFAISGLVCTVVLKISPRFKSFFLKLSVVDQVDEARYESRLEERPIPRVTTFRPDRKISNHD